MKSLNWLKSWCVVFLFSVWIATPVSAQRQSEDAKYTTAVKAVGRLDWEDGALTNQGSFVVTLQKDGRLALITAAHCIVGEKGKLPELVHCVVQGQEFWKQVKDGVENGTVIIDRDLDLAVMIIPVGYKGILPVRTGFDWDYPVGEPVKAVGFLRGDRTISLLRCTGPPGLLEDGRKRLSRVMFEGIVDHGMSGGGVFHKDILVGITVAMNQKTTYIYKGREYRPPVAFAVPLTLKGK